LHEKNLLLPAKSLTVLYTETFGITISESNIKSLPMPGAVKTKRRVIATSPFVFPADP
jgi:hypothetical protein